MKLLGALSLLACPICGVDEPHSHGSLEICDWLHKQAARFNLNVEIFDKTEHKDHIEYLESVRGRFHEFVKSMSTGKSIDFAWQLWCQSLEGKAHLIAAAPCLLEALQCLLPGLVLDLRYADDDDDKEAMQSRVDTVVTAINKATGHDE